MLEKEQLNTLLHQIKKRVYFFIFEITIISSLIITVVNCYEYRMELDYITEKNAISLNYTVNMLMETSDISHIQIYIQRIVKLTPEYALLILVDQKGKVLASSDTEWSGKNLSEIPSYLIGDDLRYALEKGSHRGVEGHGTYLDFSFQTPYGAFMIHYDTWNLFKSFLYFAAVNISIFSLAILIVMYFLHKKTRKYFLQLMEEMQEQFEKFSIIKGFSSSKNPYAELQEKHILELLFLFFQNLIEERKWYFLFMKQFTVPFILLDTSRKIIFSNQEAESLMGRAIDDLQTETWIDSVENIDRKKVLDTLQNLIKSNKRQTCDFTFITPDAMKNPVKGKFDVIKDVQDEVKGYLCLFEKKD